MGPSRRRVRHGAACSRRSDAVVLRRIQQGALFAADAARGSLLGLVGVAAFCLAYARASTRLHWSLCLLIGWSSFAVVTVLMYRVQVGPIPALVLAVAALFGARAGLPGSRSERGAAQLVAKVDGAAIPQWDLPMRMASAAALVFTLTSVADRLGSSVSGILTPFPVATAILAGFTHAQHGSAACVEFLRDLHAGVVRVRGLLRDARADAAASADRGIVHRRARDPAGAADGACSDGSRQGPADRLSTELKLRSTAAKASRSRRSDASG